MTLDGKITIDGTDIWTTYGIYALKGSFDDLVKLPVMKAPTSVSPIDQNGENVYLQNRKVDNEDITLKLLLTGSSIADMFAKRDALTAKLIADCPGGNAWYFTTLNKTYHMYYKTCTGAKFINAAKKRIELTLTFRLLR